MEYNMNSVNKVILVGHLGRDPEIRVTPSGDTVAELNLATSESYKKDGQRQEKTEWHNLVAWRKQAEFASNYLKKGAMVYVEGKLQTQTWEKDGEKRYKTVIQVSQITALSGGSDNPKTTDDDEIPF
jgi:single-strand DNA-binding protein